MSNKEIELPEGISADEAVDVLREYGSTDDAQIVNQTVMDALTEAKEAFAAVLSEDSPQSADTLARQDMAGLTEPFRDEEGDIDVDTLRQEPETGDVGSDEPTDEPGGFDPDTLSRDEVTEIEALDRKKTAFENRDVNSRVEVLEGEMAEVAGVDDFDEIELEAL